MKPDNANPADDPMNIKTNIANVFRSIVEEQAKLTELTNREMFDVGWIVMVDGFVGED